MEECKFYKKRGSGKRKNTQPYPYELKIKIIKEYQAGGETYRSLSKKYGIGSSLIVGWVKKIQCNLIPKKKPSRILDKFIVVNMDNKKDGHSELAHLQRALEDALLKNKALETMITIAEEQLKINIRKKSGTKQSQK